MKKLLFVATVVAMSLGCIGCGGGNNATPNNNTTNGTMNDTTNGVSNGAPNTTLENSMINGMPGDTTNNVTGDTIGTEEDTGVPNDAVDINGNPVAQDNMVTAPNHSDTVASSANGNTNTTVNGVSNTN